MEKQTLTAEVRTVCGKGPARRLRAEGKAPAVLYGPGLDPTPLTVTPKSLVKALQGPFGRNVVFELAYADTKVDAMVKEITMDPLGKELLHVDFLKVDPSRTVLVDVPFKTKGRAVGVQRGGQLNVTVRTVPVRCTPDSIPSVITVDVSALGLHDTIAVKDLTLPEGVTVTLRPELTLAIVLEDKKAAKAAEEEAAAAS